MLLQSSVWNLQMKPNINLPHPGSVVRFGRTVLVPSTGQSKNSLVCSKKLESLPSHPPTPLE